MAISFDLRSSSAKYRYCNINFIKLVFIFIKNDSHYNLWPHKIYTWTNCDWIQVLMELFYAYGGTNWWIILAFGYEMVVLEKRCTVTIIFVWTISRNVLIEWFVIDLFEYQHVFIKVVSVEICIPFYWCTTLIVNAIFNCHKMFGYI